MKDDIDLGRQYVRENRLDLAVAFVLTAVRNHLTRIQLAEQSLTYHDVERSEIALILREEITSVHIVLTDILQKEVLTRLAQEEPPNAS